MKIDLVCVFSLIDIKPFENQRYHHIEASQLIYFANRLTGFYMMGTLT